MITLEILGLALWLTPVVAYYLVLPAVQFIKGVTCLAKQN
jgi:hypothetical protein